MKLRIGENITREWSEEPAAWELQSGLRLMEHDPVSGEKVLQGLAEKGSALSMMYLGHAYLAGQWGLKKNSKLGEALLNRSAELGSIEGAFALAKYLQDHGQGSAAISLFESLAERQYSPALFILGWKYYIGQFVDKDLNKSLFYFDASMKARHLYGAFWTANIIMKYKKGFLNKLRALSIRVTTIIPTLWYIFLFPSSDRLRR